MEGSAIMREVDRTNPDIKYEFWDFPLFSLDGATSTCSRVVHSNTSFCRYRDQYVTHEENQPQKTGQNREIFDKADLIGYVLNFESL